jgi:hypothetical protein
MVSWERFEKFHDEIKAATGNAMLETTGRKGEVTCSFTHVYPDGPAPVCRPAWRGSRRWRGSGFGVPEQIFGAANQDGRRGYY